MALVKILVIGGAMVCSLSLEVSWGQGQSVTALQPMIPPKPFPPTPGQSRIAYFRELIAATPEQRGRLLEGASPDYRRVLENGVRRYEALSPQERELRLRTMELRFHVTSVIRAAPSNRLDRLKMVPDRDRSFVEERLAYYDRLPPEEKKEVLENELLLRDIFTPPIPSRSAPVSGPASNQVRRIEEQLVRWQNVPESRRALVQKHFTSLFEFTEAEKAREQLDPLPLSDEERRLMQETLDRFQKLSPTQRAQCVRNFARFAELSPAERRQFLANAQEWQRMSAEDRETWRRLVSKVPRLPPLPPGLAQPPLPGQPNRLPQPKVASDTNR